MSRSVALGAVCLVLAACAPPTAGLTKGVAVDVPPQWKQFDMRGYSYTVCLPADCLMQEGTAEMMAAAKVQSAEGEEIVSVAYGRGGGEADPFAVVVSETKIKARVNEAAFIEGMKKGLNEQGGFVGGPDAAQKTPIGNAHSFSGSATMNGMPVKTVVYTWFDKESAYALMVIGLKSDPQKLAGQIAQTFRVR